MTEQKLPMPSVRTAVPETTVRTYSVVLSSGQPAEVTIPVDMDDRAWLDLLAIILTVVRPEHERRAGRNPLVNLLLGGHNRGG